MMSNDARTVTADATTLLSRILLLLLLLPILIVGLQSCDETPTEPDPGVTIEEVVLEEKSATIGTEGGSLVLDDGMKAEIPAGSLSDETELTLRKIGSERFFDGPNRTAYRLFVSTEPDQILLSFPVEPGGTADDIGVLNYDPESFFQDEADIYPFEYDEATGTVTVRASANRTLPDPNGGAGRRSGKIKEKNTWVVEKEPLVEPDVETKVVAMPFYAQDQLTCWAASIHMMTRGYRASASSRVPDYLKYAGYPPTTGPGALMYRVKVPSLLNIHAASGATGTIYWRGTSAFNNLVKQISAGRPVLIGRSGHSVMIIGYRKTTQLYGPASYEFLVHDPGDPDWGNQWKKWDWVIDGWLGTFAQVWIPQKPLEDRTLQTVGLPMSGATGYIRFLHTNESGDVVNDATLGIDPTQPKWYGWKLRISSVDEIPGTAETLAMQLPVWNADRSSTATVVLDVSVRKIDEKEVYSTSETRTLPVGSKPTDVTFEVPVEPMRTGTGEPDYRLTVQLRRSDGKVADQFDLLFRLAPPAPVIESVSPDPAIAGEQITIIGKNFGDRQSGSTVMLGDDRLTDISDWSATQIRLRLPTTALTNDLYVTVGEQESAPYELTVESDLDLMPKLSTSIVAIARFTGIHQSEDGTGFDRIEISSGGDGTEIEWSGSSFSQSYDYTEPDGSGGERRYTLQMSGTMSSNGDRLLSVSALLTERWDAPQGAFVQIDTKELVFGEVPYSRSVISSDKRFETLLYELYGASVRSRLSKAVWKVLDGDGIVQFAYSETDWEDEFAPPGLTMAFGRENK